MFPAAKPATPGRARALLVGAGLLLAAAALCHAEPPPSPTVQPAASEPVTSQPATKAATGRTEKIRRLVRRTFDYLTEMHLKQLRKPDPIARAVAVISLSRLPGAEATEGIIGRVRDDRDPVVRVVAWQALLARAGRLSEAQRRTWQEATREMVREDLFHGDLRIGLLEMLSATPATPEDRRYFRNLFEHTNSLDSGDIPTLIAMGRALKAWGDAQLVEDVLGALRYPHAVVRAELVLRAAGIGPGRKRPRRAHQAYRQWWEQHRQAFIDAGRNRPAWDALKPQIVPGPYDIEKVDPSDAKWNREAELPRFHLSQFDFAICLDASRSMRNEIRRLKRDMGIIFSALKVVSRELRIGLTLFAPGRTVEHLPLQSRYRVLRAALEKVKIIGPAGEEEWAGALKATIAGSKWISPGQYNRRVIVVLSDEPLTRSQYEKCLALAKAGADHGFTVHWVKIRKLKKVPRDPLSEPFDRTPGTVEDNPGVLERLGRDRKSLRQKRRERRQARNSKPDKSWFYYDRIAEATGGTAEEVHVPQGELGLGVDPGSGGGKAGRPRVAPIYPGGGPTSRVLTMVLLGAMPEGYADRVEPFVRVVVNYCQQYARHVPERRRGLAGESKRR